jgi:hypothetical protein
METGAYGAPLLSPANVRKMRFIVPHELLYFTRHIFGIEIEKRIADMKAKGGDAVLFGWPDGATVLWSRPYPDLPLDEEAIDAAYYSFHRSVTLAELEGFKC